MRLFITGATGFVGQHLVKYLHAQGHEIIALCRSRDDAQRTDLATLANVHFVEGDIVKEGGLERASKVLRETPVAAVIHLVGIIREKGDVTFHNVHVEGTKHVVELTKEAGVSRYLHMSALGSTLDTKSEYFKTKAHAEEIVKSSRLEYTIFCPSLIFGIGDAFFGETLRELVTLPPVIPQIGDGHFPFRPVWVGDVVRAYSQALNEDDTVFARIELVGPIEYTFRQLLNLMQQALQTKKNIVPVPVALMKFGTPLLQVFPEPPITQDQLLMVLAGNTGSPNPQLSYFDLPMKRLPEVLPDIIEAAQKKDEK